MGTLALGEWDEMWDVSHERFSMQVFLVVVLLMVDDFPFKTQLWFCFFRNGVEGFSVCGGLERFANKHQRLLPVLVDNKFGEAVQKIMIFRISDDWGLFFLLVPISVNDSCLLGGY